MSFPWQKKTIAPFIATPNGDMRMGRHCDKERRKDTTLLYGTGYIVIHVHKEDFFCNKMDKVLNQIAERLCMEMSLRW